MIESRNKVIGQIHQLEYLTIKYLCLKKSWRLYFIKFLAKNKKEEKEK